MALRPRARKTKGITHGRPPLLKARPATLSSEATRSIIRSHHKLHKEHAKAVEQGDAAQASDLKRAINDKGGLQSYQIASTLGQSSARGGDSSKVLVEWLQEAISNARSRDARLRMLEIGALSTKNACSQVDCLDVTRIDLHSQEPGIREIDFMDLPTPESKGQRYEIISLSLVLNFVPDPAARGAMLRRIPDFLSIDSSEAASGHLPSLFLVLPLPCVANSRYLTDGRLVEMMASLGFSLIRVKKTSKLHYSLWKRERNDLVRSAAFKKEELRSGSSRNNFAITMLMES
jgi:25S rRNA (adenine2142-N1)-methyltransferase